jgi:Ankyrin repeats (3 copies)
MTKHNFESQSRIGAWIPSVVTADTGEISMFWLCELESGFRDDGGVTSPVKLDYRHVQVEMHWISERKCSLNCRAPGMKDWKDLHDSGYRGVLAIDRHVGRVIAINEVDRSTWWLAILTAYSAVDGPRTNDATEFMQAAAADDVRRLEELLAKGAHIESSNMIGETALSSAAESGMLSAFEFLLARGANPRPIMSGGGTLMHAAAGGGNVEIISTLIARGLDLNTRAASGHTPLGWAIWHGRAEAAASLLRAGADPAAERGLDLCEQSRVRFGEDHPLAKQLCR